VIELDPNLETGLLNSNGMFSYILIFVEITQNNSKRFELKSEKKPAPFDHISKFLNQI